MLGSNNFLNNSLNWYNFFNNCWNFNNFFINNWDLSCYLFDLCINNNSLFNFDNLLDFNYLFCSINNFFNDLRNLNNFFNSLSDGNHLFNNFFNGNWYLNWNNNLSLNFNNLRNLDSCVYYLFYFHISWYFFNNFDNLFNYNFIVDNFFFIFRHFN